MNTKTLLENLEILRAVTILRHHRPHYISANIDYVHLMQLLNESIKIVLSAEPHDILYQYD